jgi:hypothetical protein
MIAESVDPHHRRNTQAPWRNFFAHTTIIQHATEYPVSDPITAATVGCSDE